MGTTPREPETEAGKRLLARVLSPQVTHDDRWRNWNEAILAIEAEAAAAERQRLADDVEGLQRQVLNAGARLDGFDHWREGASSKPSDPEDIRWDCICGYSGDPEKVQRHWFVLLRTEGGAA